MLATCPGCQMFSAGAMLFGKDPMRKVAAEYPQLAGKKVAILVWAEMDTLFEYPHVQYEVSEFVRAAMNGNVKAATFVPNRSIVEFQRREPDWDRMDPAEIGRRFAAERVLLLELTRYSTREADSPHLYRGRIAANVAVIDSQQSGAEPLYRTSVETIYPPGAPSAWGIDDAAIRQATMEAFGADVARKFYDHEIKR